MIDVVLGLQYGDEGKGRIVDYLLGTDKYKYCYRWGGSSNAGHSIFRGKDKIITHSIPSGILDPTIINVIERTCLIDPIGLKNEIIDLRSKGLVISPDNLIISPFCHVTLPEYIEEEKSRSLNTKLGTTLRGVGPTFEKKYAREGIRLCDLFSSCPENILDAFLFIREFINNTPRLRLSDSVLCEGAQSHFLDIDYGDYPFVSCGTATVAGVLLGLGVPPKFVNSTFGVFKPYNTKVGTGNFQYECDAETSEIIRSLGEEYGATTGRPRRIGWLDLTQIDEACRINGVERLYLTKLDIAEKIIAKLGYMLIYSGNDSFVVENTKDLIKILTKHFDKPIFISKGVERNNIEYVS